MLKFGATTCLQLMFRYMSRQPVVKRNFYRCLKNKIPNNPHDKTVCWGFLSAGFTGFTPLPLASKCFLGRLIRIPAIQQKGTCRKRGEQAKIKTEPEREIASRLSLVAGLAGFEPTGCSSQSPVPYRLATAQNPLPQPAEDKDMEKRPFNFFKRPLFAGVGDESRTHDLQSHNLAP